MSEASDARPRTDDAGTAALTARALVLGSLAVALGTALVLLLQAPHFDPGRLHVSGPFRDQAGFIITARQWLDTGELRSGLLYPAYADQANWRPYMPGHYLALLVSYALFGYGVLASLLPNLLSHVLAAVGTFWIGARSHGLRAGLLGASLFAFLPSDVGYAFTAMGVPTTTAACALALGAFLLLPPRVRPWAAAPLLAVPFLFRETSALTVMPMALIVWRDAPGRRGAVRFLVCGATSVLLLGVLNQWQVASGKMSNDAAISWLTGGFDYYDGAEPQDVELTTGELVAALRRNVARNLRITAEQVSEDPLQPALTGLWFLAALLALALWRTARTRGRDPLALGSALVLIASLVFIYALYDVKGHKLVRHTMFTGPFLCAAAGFLATSAAARRGPALAGLGVYVLACVAAARGYGRELVAEDPLADAGTALIESFHHDDERLLLVHPFLVRHTLAYAEKHYPVPWSLIPKHLESLQELEKRYLLGTLLLAADTPGAESRAPVIFGGRLRLLDVIEVDGKEYLVYQAR